MTERRVQVVGDPSRFTGELIVVLRLEHQARTVQLGGDAVEGVLGGGPDEAAGGARPEGPDAVAKEPAKESALLCERFDGVVELLISTLMGQREQFRRECAQS